MFTLPGSVQINSYVTDQGDRRCTRRTRCREWRAGEAPNNSCIRSRNSVGLIGAQSINEVDREEDEEDCWCGQRRRRPETHDRHVTKSWVTLKNGHVPVEDSPAATAATAAAPVGPFCGLLL